MVISCLFLWYDPSIPPQKSLKGGKSTNASLQIRDFCLFPISKWRVLKSSTKLTPKGLFCKYFICSISFNKCKAKLVVTVS